MTDDCADKVVEASNGKMSREAALKVLAQMEQNRNNFFTENPGLTSRDFADKQLGEHVARKRAVFVENRNKLINFERKEFNLDVIRNAASADSKNSGKAMYESIKGLISQTGRNKRRIREGMTEEFKLGLNKIDSTLIDELESKAHSNDLMQEVTALQKYHYNPDTGLRERITPDKVLPATENKKARQIAEVWTKLEDDITDRLNAHGADITQREGYGAKQSWDAEKIASVGREKFLADLTSKMDFKESWGGNIPGDSKAFFNDLYDRLASGIHDFDIGAGDSAVPQMFTGSGNIAKKMSLERQIILRPEAMNEMSLKYGAGGIENSMSKKIATASRDLALLKQFGTNPEAHIFGQHGLIPTLLEETKKLGEGGAHPLKDAEKGGLKHLFDEVTGQANATINTPRGQIIRRVSDTVLQLNVLDRLGSVLFSSISDLPNKNMVLRNLGVDPMTRYITLFNDTFGNYGNKERQAMAKALALGMEDLSGSLYRAYDGAAGYVGAPSVYGKRGKLSTTVKEFQAGYKDGGIVGGVKESFTGVGDLFMKMTLLDDFTKNNKQGTTVTISNFLGSFADDVFSNLEDGLKYFLNKNGLAEDWDMIRSKVETTTDGNRFVTPNSLRELTLEDLYKFRPDLEALGEKHGKEYLKELPERLLGALVDRRETATLTPGTDVDSSFRMGTKRGTILGEFLMHIEQFKKFPVSQITEIYGKELAGRGKDFFLANAPRLFTQMTVAGMVGLSLQAISQGKTPPALIDEEGNLNFKTVFAAIVKGGGAGILGDMIFKDPDYQAAVFGDLLGPTFGTAERAIEIALRSPARLMDGEGNKVLADMTKFVKSNLPFGNLFYTKSALEFLFFNDLLEMIQPGYKSKVEKQNRDKSQQWLIPDAPRSLGEVFQ